LDGKEMDTERRLIIVRPHGNGYSAKFDGYPEWEYAPCIQEAIGKLIISTSDSLGFCLAQPGFDNGEKMLKPLFTQARYAFDPFPECPKCRKVPRDPCLGMYLNAEGEHQCRGEA
jgi:hypothetical protein